MKAFQEDLTLILDAAALMEIERHSPLFAARQYPAVLTPHVGEMAALLGCEAAEIEADRIAAVRRAARHYGAIVVLKGSNSLIADRDGTLLFFALAETKMLKQTNGDS